MEMVATSLRLAEDKNLAGGVAMLPIPIHYRPPHPLGRFNLLRCTVACR